MIMHRELSAKQLHQIVGWLSLSYYKRVIIIIEVCTAVCVSETSNKVCGCAEGCGLVKGYTDCVFRAYTNIKIIVQFFLVV